jgi:hypothetical protein
MGTNFARLSASTLALTLLLAPGAGAAENLAPLFHAPSAKVPSKPKFAVLVALKLRLPEGRGLARLLLDAGVNRDDAAAAARLAAGHLGDGHGGCDATAEVSEGMDGNGLRLERVELQTQAGRTTIERREGELTIASQQSAGKNPRLV